jgi:hypothetical protein
LTYFNAALAKRVCQELSLDPVLWLGEDNSLLLEFFLLVAGESKFAQFVPIAMKNDHRESRVQDYDWELSFERNREPTSEDKSFLNTVAEFREKFLLKKIPSGKQGQRYLVNTKIQLGASAVEHALKASPQPIKHCIESIASCYDVEVTAGELAHLNAFYMKALLKTHEGRSLVVWLAEKVGNGYHSPCEYVTLQVMPLNEISALALGLKVYEQGIVYYHFFELQTVVNTQLCKALFSHLSPFLTERVASSHSNSKKRPAQGTLESTVAKKQRTDSGSVATDAEEPNHGTFLTLYNALLKVRLSVPRRLGAFTNQTSYFHGQEDPVFAAKVISKDWK